MKLINNISRKELGWDSFYYYKIYEDDGLKKIKYDCHINRVDIGKPYLSWVVWVYDCTPMEVETYLEWDRFYQETKMINGYEEYEFEPQECFEIANLLLNQPEFDSINNYIKGRYRLDRINIDENTPCGYYFGL